MHTRLMTVAIAAAASMALHAQTPQTTSTHQPPDDRRPTITQSTARATPANPSMTISGCLTQREAAKAGLKPGERGMPEDYILTNVKMSPSSTVSGIGVSTKYQILGISDIELKKHLNHHVELIGQIVPPGSTGQPADDTPDFQATTLKMVSLACSAAQ
ncbi:MAG TPA: hypothetical protein VFZ31_01850 [Vicinamibacterales bacterium]